MTKKYSVKFEPDVPIELRDGTTTYADIYRPDSAGQFPALLQRTPYDKSSVMSKTGSMDSIRAAMNGYISVIQDVRGRYSSEGEFYTFINEINDGYDSIEWLATQPWCNGKVGMHGASYVGATQWLAAKSKPPSLSAIAPTVTASDYHEGWAWQGGAFELGFNLSWAVGHLTAANWANLTKRLDLSKEGLEDMIKVKDSLTESFNHLPLQNYPHLQDSLAPYYYGWLDHPEYDEYWKEVCIEESHSEISVPAFNIGGWYDIFLGGTIRNYTRMKELGSTDNSRKGQKLIIGPWVHGGNPAAVSGEYNFGTLSSGPGIDLHGLVLRYYDYWLKGEENGLLDDKPVQIFVMGDNVWRSEEDWPLARTDYTNFYMHSDGEANSLAGNGSLNLTSPKSESPDVYLYNPLNPVPTRGGQLCCDPAFMKSGVYDQRPVEMRSDVLVYSTEPLEQDLEVTGPITVVLYAASSARDTDFTAKLVDVEPSGYSRNLTDGIIRARYRNQNGPTRLIQAGEIYKYEIDIWATSNVFKKGHQIRLEISSSNFPRFDRNTNTGNPIGKDKDYVSALQTVYHNSDYPSHVVLPVIPVE